MQSEYVCPSSSCWSYLASPENNMTQTHRLPELKTCPIIQWQMVLPQLPLPRVIPASERQLPGTPAPCSPRTGCTRSRCCPADGSWSRSSSCSARCSAGSAAVWARKAWLKAGGIAPSPGSSQSYQHTCPLASKASSAGTTVLQKRRELSIPGASSKGFLQNTHKWGDRSVKQDVPEVQWEITQVWESHFKTIK